MPRKTKFDKRISLIFPEILSKIARPTVNQTLTKLLKLKKVDRLGLARSTRYRIG